MITLNSKNFKSYVKNNNSPISSLINAYNNYINTNSFSNLKCPNCKRKHTLSFHKTYDRHLSYIDNGVTTDIVIHIVVLKCSDCSQKDNCQKYHALLPDFIFPYHIYGASTIINVLYLRLVKQSNLQYLLACFNITHKLFYEWLYKFKKYLLSASIVLGINKSIDKVIDVIYNNKRTFLNNFYQNYYHPFFLFKVTCVPLCITP